MTARWIAILIASVGCYGLKLAGLCLPESVLRHASVQRIAGLLPLAMLSALIAVDLFGANGRYSFDWHALAGVAAASVALRLRQGLLVVFLVAITVSAASRLAG
jgi:branched-subunit amino acid transport protein